MYNIEVINQNIVSRLAIGKSVPLVQVSKAEIPILRGCAFHGNEESLLIIKEEKFWKEGNYVI